MSQTLPIRVAALLVSQAASAAIQHALLAPEFAITLIDADHWRGVQTDAVLIEVEDDLAVLRGICDEVTGTPIIVLLRSARADLAFAASKAGAKELITLPAAPDEIRQSLRGILTTQLKAPAPQGLPVLFGNHPRMSEIRDTISKVATTSATVLIRGESGVGKDVVARMIYEQSRRSGKPFVKVNCAAIPDDLLESELFGYEAGAFTGATRSKPGRFEMAHTGTLFLDEIGEMQPALQAKLLHVLQDGAFARLGAKQDVAVDVRVLCATNKLLEQRVTEGLFREDLFYRINVVTVHIPPLRERRDEIGPLIRHFLYKYAAIYGREQAFFSEEAMAALLTYSWPGNIRELENLCKRFVIVGGETQILRELTSRNQHAGATPAQVASPAQQPHASVTAAEPTSLRQPVSTNLLEVGKRAAWQAERRLILETLEAVRWNRKLAAQRLGISYRSLRSKIELIDRDEATKRHLIA